MPPQLKPLDLDMRQRLAQTLSGDAKPGSIRANLVKGLLGSQVGDDQGLVGMTPLGAVFSADAANRDIRAGGSGVGNTLSAAAGMIPGEGELGSGATRLAEPIIQQAFVLGKKGLKDAPNAAAHAIADAKNQVADWYAERGMKMPKGIEFKNPTFSDTMNERSYSDYPGEDENYWNVEVHGMPGDHATVMLADNGAKPGLVKKTAQAAYDQSRLPKIDATLKPSNLGAGSDAVRGGPGTPSDPEFHKNPSGGRGGPGSLDDPDHPSNIAARNALKPGLHTRAQGEAMGADYSDIAQHEPDILRVAAGDTAKANFIRQAMQDEGGNIPEEVADTLIGHLGEKNPSLLKRMMDDHEIISSRAEHGTDINDQSLEELTQSLAQNHSIPEMLGAHYDLNPELMSKAYAEDNVAPAAAKVSPRKPTQ